MPFEQELSADLCDAVPQHARVAFGPLAVAPRYAVVATVIVVLAAAMVLRTASRS